MQSDVRKFVFQHLEEHWEKVCDGPRKGKLRKTDVKPWMTYSSLPRIGAKPLIWVPKAARTCWEVSDTKSSMLVIISLSNVSRSSSPQKPEQNK